ncbi:MAG: hypothetical protein ACU0DI_09280 [Paracoccaceae bacterium]
MHRLSILALLLLAACATPLERCIASATKELRVLSGLIASTQANINRGYAIVTENYFVTLEQVCGEVEGEKVYCDVPVAKSRDVPVAIDLNAEQAKLNSLLTKRAGLGDQAEARIEYCNIQHQDV